MLSQKTKVPGRKTNEGMSQLFQSELQECGHKAEGSQMLEFSGNLKRHEKGGGIKSVNCSASATKKM
jgi:hypothetical protein